MSRIARAVILWGACCIARAQPPTMIKVDDSFNGRQVRLQAGEVLEVALAENATTGFRWLVKAKPDFLAEFQDTEPPQPAPPGPPGRGGVRRFYFRAERKGTGELELEYRRSWETEKPAARSYKLRVRVTG